MALKKWTNSSKYFSVALILALALLVFIGSTSYKQMQQRENATAMVTHTLAVEKEINGLFSNYAMMQSSAYESMLRLEPLNTSRFKNYKLKADSIYTRLNALTANDPKQQQYLKKAQNTQQKLYTSLESLFETRNASVMPKTNWTTSITPVSVEMSKLATLKNNMLNEEEIALKLYEETYDSSFLFKPLIILSLGVFALVVFLFSFWRINQQRKETKQINEFLQNILYNSDDVISYFIPIYDAQGKITDFIIDFTNTAIEDVLGQAPKEVENKLMSKLLPMNFENGIFKELTLTAKTKEKRQFETLFEYEGKNTWFFTKAVPLNDGVLTTSVDTTLQHTSQQKQKELTRRLETQNLELLDNRAFLSNIFKSVSEIIMNLECIRDKEGKIIDFKILFINDAINEITGEIPQEIKNKKVSELYPTIFENDVFNNLVRCVKEERQVVYETNYNQDGKTLWFNATATKLNDGVTVTTREVTEEKLKAVKLSQLNQDLQIQNSIFKDAEAVADVGSYVWYLDTGEATISDNFYRMLGLEPNAIKITIDVFRTFVHPDDLDIYDQFNEETSKQGFSNIHSYRIVSKKNIVKHLYLNSSTTIKDGRKVSIGVVQDITKQVKLDRKLKDKNTDLQKSNAELESFNRVASHDLQEPMRKIQMFISRISESEAENLSHKGTLYFEKVASAASRMQNLIKHLLSYSRLNKTKKDFTQVQVKDIIAEVLEDLEESIEQSDMKIVVDDLPTIKAIPFQMEQLFSNLLSNAIKYRKTDVQPEIRIESKKIASKKITANFDKKKKTYHRISVSDNGIGFDASYADKIFDLFERLHGRDEYSGTGIGLAICKKIAENHGGYITAESTISKGAKFIVYLPA